MSIAAQMNLFILLFSWPVLAWDTVIMTMISIVLCFVAKVLNDDLEEVLNVLNDDLGESSTIMKLEKAEKPLSWK